MQNDSVNYCVAFVPFISSSFGKTNAKTKKKRLFTEKENYDYQNFAINYGFHHFNIPTSTGDRNPRRVDANMHFGAEVQNIFVSCCHGNNSHA